MSVKLLEKAPVCELTSDLFLYVGTRADMDAAAHIAETAVFGGDYPNKDGMLDYLRNEDGIRKGLEMVLRDNGVFYMAKTRNGHPVGFIAAHPKRDARVSDLPFWNMNKFYMRPESQGQGLGSRMIRLVMQEGIARGHSILYLQTHADFHPAIALYEKLGFQHTKPCLDWNDPLCVEMIYRVAIQSESTY